MKKKVTGILSLEISLKLPPKIEIPKDSKSSLLKLRKNLKSLSTNFGYETTLKPILEIINTAIEFKGISTRILQKNSILLIWIRFENSADAQKFKNTIPKKIIKSLLIKLEISEINSTLPPKNTNLREMIVFISCINPAITKTSCLLNGNISKVYVKDSETLNVWISFRHYKNVVEFIEALQYF